VVAEVVPEVATIRTRLRPLAEKLERDVQDHERRIAALEKKVG